MPEQQSESQNQYQSQPQSQKVLQDWETPSHDEIPRISRMHVGVLETSDDDGVWTAGGMPHLIVHTVGRKSGSVHKIALPTWTDPEGHRIVVASYAGAAKDPAWFLNLRDGGGAEVLCIAQRGRYLSVPEVLVGDDYDRIWRLLTGDRAWYLDYQSKTDRRIPLIRLPEPRSAPRQPG